MSVVSMEVSGGGVGDRPARTRSGVPSPLTCPAVADPRLLLLSSSDRGGVGRDEQAVDVTSDVALEAAHRTSTGCAFADALVDVGAGCRVPSEMDHDDAPQRHVGVSVAATVEPVAGPVCLRSSRNGAHVGLPRPARGTLGSSASAITTPAPPAARRREGRPVTPRAGPSPTPSTRTPEQPTATATVSTCTRSGRPASSSTPSTVTSGNPTSRAHMGVAFVSNRGSSGSDGVRTPDSVEPLPAPRGPVLRRYTPLTQVRSAA